MAARNSYAKDAILSADCGCPRPQLNTPSSERKFGTDCDRVATLVKSACELGRSVLAVLTALSVTFVITASTPRLLRPPIHRWPPDTSDRSASIECCRAVNARPTLQKWTIRSRRSRRDCAWARASAPPWRIRQRHRSQRRRSHRDDVPGGRQAPPLRQRRQRRRLSAYRRRIRRPTHQRRDTSRPAGHRADH